MASKRLEELQKKLQEAEEHDGETLTDEELEELEAGGTLLVVATILAILAVILMVILPLKLLGNPQQQSIHI